jgi:hypothetical protein
MNTPNGCVLRPAMPMVGQSVFCATAGAPHRPAARRVEMDKRAQARKKEKVTAKAGSYWR